MQQVNVYTNVWANAWNNHMYPIGVGTGAEFNIFLSNSDSDSNK